MAIVAQHVSKMKEGHLIIFFNLFIYLFFAQKIASGPFRCITQTHTKNCA